MLKKKLGECTSSSSRKYVEKFEQVQTVCLMYKLVRLSTAGDLSSIGFDQRQSNIP